MEGSLEGGVGTREEDDIKREGMHVLVLVWGWCMRADLVRGAWRGRHDENEVFEHEAFWVLGFRAMGSSGDGGISCLGRVGAGGCVHWSLERAFWRRDAPAVSSRSF